MASPDNPTMPSYTFTVNGVNLASHLEDSTFTITQQWSRQGDTAIFYLVDEHGDGAQNFYVPPLAKIVLTDTSINQKLFSGVCSMPELKYQGPNSAYWYLSCTDWTYLGDRTTVFGDFQTMSADQIVKALVTQSASGITVNNVQIGPMIPRIQINYMPLTQALTKICQYASTNATYGWYVDENTDLHFNDQTQAGALQAFFSDIPTDFGPSAYVPGYTGNYNTDWYYLWDATSIRNSITVLGGTYPNNQTDEWLGNGTQVSWPLTYTPDQTNFTALASMTVAGSPVTVSVQTGTSSSTQWAIVQNVSGQWFLTANTAAAPTGGQAVIINYPYLAPVVSRVASAASIAEFSNLPNNGVFAETISDTTLQNLAAAQARGRRELNTYGLPEERVFFNSSQTFTGHVRAGQLIQYKNKFVPDSTNSYAPGVNDTFLVVQNRISGSFTGYRSYQITAARVDTGGGP